MDRSRTRGFDLAITLLCATLLAACGRSAGPNADERTQITYWLVNSAEVDNHDCSDDSSVTTSLLTPPRLNQGVAWYYVYNVSADGTHAVHWTCNPSNWTQCQEDPSLTYSVDNHVLMATLPPSSGTFSGNCQLVATETLRLEDKGDDMDATQTVTFQLTGPSTECAAAEAKLRERSSNGAGVSGCVSTLRMSASFSHTRNPADVSP